MVKSKDNTQKTLIIAEKPSVASDLAKALGGKFHKDKSYLEREDTIISWALGHLVGIADPKDIGEQYKTWNMATLPIIPQKFKLIPLPDTKTHLSQLGKLIRRKDISTIVNACDAGREGELIFYYILEHEQGKTGIKDKTIKRLWVQSMTLAAIKEAFENLRSNSEMKNLQDAALSRSEADWLVGINGSRGLTAYNSRFGGFQLTPCGRVQTPTLALIVKREESRMAFVPQAFWTLIADFEDCSEHYIGKWTNQKENSQKIWKKEEAEAILKKCKGMQGSISEESKQETQKCPPLYDLTFLQREANNRFGFSAKTTLQIAQALYEKHKLTTYPRTDSKFLPDDYVATVKKTMGALTGGIAKYAELALKNNYVHKDPRIFNTAKVSDHHAIIPTGHAPATLSEAEQKIFSLICQRFVAVFYPVAEYLHTTRITTVEGETFISEGKILKEPGWKAVYGKESEEDEDIMPKLSSPNAKPIAKEIEMAEDSTKPPARYTESSLLSAMESAGKLIEDEDLRDAMKERGLGTPATRAATIEKLISDKYIVREGKELLPTGKAFDLISMAVSMQIENLTSPELTGEWEYQLGLMEKGKVSRKSFMHDIENLTSFMVDKIKNFKESDTKKEAVAEAGGEKINETVSNYETDSGIRIRKILGGRRISIAEVVELLEKKKLGPLEGFRSKKGKVFSAALILNEKNKVEFVFEDLSSGSRESLDFSGQTPVGNSPRDGSPVYEALTAFVSQSYADGKNTGIRIAKSILGKTLNAEHIKSMLNGEKTELIKGFRSAKTRRLFDAFLKMDKSGKIRFEFPPKQAKSKKLAKKS